MQDYVASICKIWFGEPVTVENFFKKNTMVFNGIKTRVVEFEKRVQEWQLEGKEETIGEVC